MFQRRRSLAAAVSKPFTVLLAVASCTVAASSKAAPGGPLDASEKCLPVAALEPHTTTHALARIRGVCDATEADAALEVLKAELPTLVDAGVEATVSVVELYPRKATLEGLLAKLPADPAKCLGESFEKTDRAIELAAVAKCAKGTEKEQPVPQNASLLTIRTNAGDDVRVFARDGEHPKRTFSAPNQDIHLVLLPPQVPYLIALKRKVPDGVESAGWQATFGRAPVAQGGDSVPLISPVGCSALSLEGISDGRIVVGGRALPLKKDQHGKVLQKQPPSIVYGSVGIVPVVVARNDGALIYQATTELKAPVNGACPVEKPFNLGRLGTVALVKVTVAPQCSEAGINETNIARIVERYVVKDAKAERFEDSRNLAAVLDALGESSKRLTPRAGRDPFLAGAPVDEVAKSLLGSGIADALVVTVDCAAGKDLRSYTVGTTRLRASLVHKREQRDDLFVQASRTTSSPDEVGIATRATLAKVFERPFVELRTGAPRYYDPGIGLTVRVDANPTKDAAADAKRYKVGVAFYRDEAACDLTQDQRRLAIDPWEELPYGVEVDPQYETREDVDQKRRAFKPLGPGEYVVQTSIAPVSSDLHPDHVIARDRRCIKVEEPRHWLRVDGAILGQLWQPQGPVERTGGYLMAAWWYQPERFPLTFGLQTGYGFASYRAPRPPSWDDIKGMGGDSVAELRWERHSLLLSPFAQLRLDPKRHVNRHAPAFLGFSWELGPLLDVGFLYLGKIPEELTTFRGPDELRTDVDVGASLRHAVSFRMPNEHELSIAFPIVQVLAIDDLALSDRNVATSEGGFQLGGAIGWGVGL